MDTRKIALIVGVEYTLNGANPEELKQNLIAGAEYLSGIGKFTQDTEAEVEMWDDRVIDGAYTGGSKGLVVEWLPQGTRFVVDEYDGAESIQTEDDRVYIA